MNTSNSGLILSIFLCFVFVSFASFSQKYFPDKYKAVGQTFTSVRIASASVIPEQWEKETNWNRIERMVRKAAGEGGARVIVTPEEILDGYVIEQANGIKNMDEKNKILKRIREAAEPIDGPYIQKVGKLADELNIFLVFADNSLVFIR
jgi:hypothetical protein